MDLVPALRAAHHLAVLTGAGVSAESGIPTFRDALTGLWADYRPEELATMAGFRRDPTLVWRWYRTRRHAVARAMPNPAHHALVTMEQRVPRFTLMTQNVDGLHTRAGNRDVVELHGNIARVKCADCQQVHAEFEDGEVVPRCQACDGLLRPDVVWFGEYLPPVAIERAQEAAATCDVFLSIGTSNIVEPAASLPWSALRHGARVAVVNLDADGQHQSPEIDFLLGKAGEILPRLVEQAWPESSHR